MSNDVLQERNKNEYGEWEIIIDFTDIDKNGVDIKDILDRL